MIKLRERRSLDQHPCFHGKASASWGRVHLPVAPDCNIQCNYCNRLYACVNESRPGVTRSVLKPAEALTALNRLLQQRADIAVVGIAGPGDPLCDLDRTLETLRAVHAIHPELLICVSTNGLNLPGHIDELVAAGVTHVTVTVNAVDPHIGQQIYSSVTEKHQTYQGLEAANILLGRQEEAVAGLKQRGLMVKINTVVLPGINTGHIPAIAAKVAAWGADTMNCIPLIPVHDTPFAELETPTEAEMVYIRKSISGHIPQIYHCRRCRADAVGLLCDNDTVGVLAL
ncbi:FeMo cofactor biosynthesis protein NifB [Sporomusa ovata DSM 2662]|uniref:FeMo cofactor biosynthesis protein NifB n=1 Tax=Sporomusa ovata TaxID=2378 RepID=A0A0U1KVM1_9FIRM|nr:radical SAM protein [Sporomusa ovata]EQB27075.1 FeMo cofactor biosynthesis protein NifB [Sporomusa ovata DSM 2662]CQR71179.1 Nitrogenase FeMo-cofactor synthesis FeS core scaffold and assembly protein NifB [Sporomusa ovata]